MFMKWKSIGSPHQLMSGNDLLLKAYDVAECMNKYFYKKVKNIRENINSIVWNSKNCRKIMKNKKCNLSMKYPRKN